MFFVSLPRSTQFSFTNWNRGEWGGESCWLILSWAFRSMMCDVQLPWNNTCVVVGCRNIVDQDFSLRHT